MRHGLLATPSREGLTRFLQLVRARLPTLNLEELRALCDARTRQMWSRALTPAQQCALTPLVELERAWYDSLTTPAPAFAVYDAPAYLAEAWACWDRYSRRYLRDLVARDVFDGATTITDLGCGLGYSTAALTEIAPGAHVTGTNVPGSLQWQINTMLGHYYGFAVRATLPPASDVVFASEYFEHFREPVAHLREVLTMSPRLLLIANTFTQRSIGHFDRYLVDGEELDGYRTTLRFNAELRAAGYAVVKLGVWNDRPLCWLRRPPPTP